MSKKTDNHCERCHNPVLCDAPHNFVCVNPTWIEDLLNDSALWKSIDDDAFPEPVSHELLRLRSIFEQRQVFAMVFQIKDVGEVLMKFPVLCSAAYLKNDVITKKLIEKPLSLGDWQSIASELLKQSQHQYVYTLPDSLRTILVDILRMYQKSLFVKQRNRFIGHGALGFDDNAEYRHYCENMLSAIAKHLDRVKEAYRHLMLSIDENNDISVTIDGESIALSPFIVRLGEELCFFDYLDGRKQPPPAYGLDYVSGGAHRRFEAPYFADVYAQLGCTYDTDFVVENSVSDLEAENVLASMNEAANFVDPTALSEWVQSNVVNEYMGGIHLLTMDRGMGKTAFVYALESGIVELDDVKVCAYYCSHAQMRGVGNFVQGVMNALNGSLVETVYKALPRLLPDSENKAENMLEVLQGYKAAYTRRGEGTKLLLILDGLDEIPADQAKVFEYIPRSEDMPENVYILLTARNPEREQLAPHVVEALNKLSIGSHYEVMPDSPKNQATLRTYLSQQDMVKTERGFRRPANAEIDRLLELSGNTFINLTVYSKLVSAGYAIDTLPELNNEQLFSHYLSILRAAYGDKLYNESLRVLLLIATAYENLTLQELAYLCGYPGITLQLLAFIKDFGALIKAVRSDVRSTELAIANERYREYVEAHFTDELQQLTEELVDRFLGEDVQDYKNDKGMEHIPDSVLYLAAYIAEYVNCYAEEIAASKETCEKLWDRIEDFGLAVSGTRLYQLNRKIVCHTGAMKLLQNGENENEYVFAGVCINRANVFHSLTRYDEALADYARVVEIWERLHREDKLPDENVLATVYMNRANTYDSLTHYEDALADYARAVEIRERLHREGRLPDENDLAMVYMNRANTYDSLTHYEDALADYARAVEIRERLHREGRLPDENDLAMVYMNQANTYFSLARYDEALADHARAVRIWERLHQEGRLPDENDLATAYMNQANTCFSLARYDEALADHARTVEIRERLLKEGRLPNENDLAMVYMNRANTYLSLTRCDEALADYTRAVGIWERLYREDRLPDENDLASVHMNRAVTYDSLTRYDEALADYTRAVRIWERLYREGRLYDENRLANVYMNRAITYRSLTRYDEALADYARAVEIQERLHRKGRLPDESYLATVYTNRAVTYDFLTRYDEALADYARAVIIWERLLQESRLHNIDHLLICYLNKALSHGKSGNPAKEVAEYTKGIALCEELPADKLISVLSRLITLYEHRAITYRDSLHEPEKAAADLAIARELKILLLLNNQ